LTFSKCSFGIYIVHLNIMSYLCTQLGFHVLKANPAISVPGLAGVVFLLSFAVSFVFNHIPIVKKYLV
ncbi:MAG: hypothetical protein K6C36_05595, partial [Clostridia bacterium]|nr:hypothetical protein [Clostridia bacterium]